MKDYSIGPLLYAPALQENIARDVMSNKFGDVYSLALCLEDTLAEEVQGKGENAIVHTLCQIYDNAMSGDFYIPKIFIRVRNGDQMIRLFQRLSNRQEILTGFILPKYTSSIFSDFNRALYTINDASSHVIYAMPVLESPNLLDAEEAPHILSIAKDFIDSISQFVIGVRIGGNDLCNALATRRNVYETIYDIAPISQVIGNIVSTFSKDYVISGPVWEYFNGDWETGMRKEIRRDMLNGLVGKTVIHPKQIPVVVDMLKVSREDYMDAQHIMGLRSADIKVGKSYHGTRMNEAPTQIEWAKKIIDLAHLYGIK